MGASNGKYGSSTAACEVGAERDVKGWLVVITGGNTGIGFETARVFASRGAHVVIGCRSEERGAAAVAKIKESTNSETVETRPLDLASLQSVRAFALSVAEAGVPLKLLINNAGIMALPSYTTTVEGYEMQWGVNHLGHFLLTSLLLGPLRQGAPSRVINVSSMAHKAARAKPLFPPTEAGYGAGVNYGDSKLSNVLFAKALNEREEQHGVTAYALHPGVIPTELGRQHWALDLGYKMGSVFMKSIPQGAATTMYCALDEGARPGGYHADCAPTESSRQGRDAALASELWKISEDLVKS